MIIKKYITFKIKLPEQSRAFSLVNYKTIILILMFN